MQKLFYLLIMCVFTTPSVAAIQQQNSCWECNLIEGIYTYTFNFVYKMYDVFRPIVYTLAWFFLAFWFLWYVWENAIKKPGTDFGDMFKSIVSKLLAYTFVIGLLSLPPKEIFKYSIDPIMNAGTGFSRWILNKSMIDTEILKTTKDNNDTRFECDKIQLSDYTIASINNARKTTLTRDNINDEEQTLTNLICITKEFGKTFNTGTKLGFSILSRSLVGLAEYKTVEIGYNSTFVQGLETAAKIALTSTLGPFATFAYNIVTFILKLWMFITYILNIATFLIGLTIAVSFLYVSILYIITILDIIIKLAMIGVMMPITIGAWLFENTRSQLSKPLFFNVINCAMRLVFLSISLTIATYLLNELMTTTFNIGDKNINLTAFTQMISDEKWWETATSGFNPFSGKNTLILQTIINSPTVIISIMFTTLICFLLISQSTKLADTFASSIESGLNDDTVLNGLKTITTSTIKYISDGVKREAGTFYKRDFIAKNLKTTPSKTNPNQATTVYDIPVDDAINMYVDQTENPSTSTINTIPNTPEMNKLIEEKKAITTQLETTKKQKSDLVLQTLETYQSFKNLTKPEQNELVEKFTNDKPIITNMEKISSLRPLAIEVIKNSDDKDSSKPVFTKLLDDINKTELIKAITDDANLDPQKKIELETYIKNDVVPPSKKDRNIIEKIKTQKITTNIKLKSKLTEIDDKINAYMDNETSRDEKISPIDILNIIKQDEVQDLESQIEDLDLDKSNPITYMVISGLKRKMKKIKSELDLIPEMNDFEAEEMASIEIDRHKKRKKRSARANINIRRK